MSKIQEKLIKAGVRNLREFGYPDCNERNILTDTIYSKFFDSMLDENMGNGFDAELLALKERIQTDPQP